MAEFLKRQYDLVVLKVTLDAAPEEPQVRFDIEVKLRGDVESVASWEVPAKQMNIPERIERSMGLHGGYPFTIPANVLDGVADWLAHESTADTPLWLHLVRPHGYLALVPWERLLQPRLKVPILRLPEFVVQPPRETPSALDVLLCSSGPQAKEDFRLVDYLVSIARELRKAVPRRTRFHIFIDDAKWDPLRQALENAALNDSNVVLYPSQSAASYAVPEATTRVTDETSRLSNPWLLWMRDSLKGRSVDVAHFICHGYMSRDRGALAFAESPLKNTDTRMSRFVGAAELKIFLTQTGAWSTVFSSPDNNYSQMGLRQLADGIAQMRPGPVLHHDLAMDPNAAALAEAYRFLYSGTPQSPPSSPALFMYCQPFQVLTASTDDVRRSFAPRKAIFSPELDSVFANTENVPAWIAASERYVEECELRLNKSGGEEELITDFQQRSVDSLQSTLNDIRSVIAKVASTTRQGGEK